MRGNDLKTVMLLAFLTALVVLVAELFEFGVVWGLAFAGLFNLAFYFWSDRLALKASRARPVSEQELPTVYGTVRRLALMSEMPMPRVYLIDSPQPNAFATGRNPKHAAVAVTTGIVQLLSPQELEGVLAHELAHVRNRDILIASVAAMLAAALTIFSRLAFWTGGGSRREGSNPLGAILALGSLILAPLAAAIIRLAISRAREYEADHDGAKTTGQPLNLASALAKIGQATQRIPMAVNPAFSSLYIADPLKALQGRRRGGLGSLFATHPPIEDRIHRLQEMASGVR